MKRLISAMLSVCMICGMVFFTTGCPEAKKEPVKAPAADKDKMPEKDKDKK